jgi:MmyB-like transcription regulator ligand binding domain
MTPGVNRLRSLFTDPAARARHPDWEQYTAAIVAHLRAQVGSQTEDARLHALIGELSLKTERFRQLWSRHDVRAGHSGAFSVRHPQFGDLELMVDNFAVTGAVGLEMLLLHAEPGTRTADAMAALAARVPA